MTPPIVLCSLIAIALGCSAEPRARIEVEGPPRGSAEEAACRAGEGGLQPLSQSATGSSVVLARRGAATLALVADRDERALIVVDLDRQRELSRTSLDARVEQLLVAPDGRVLAALSDDHRLQVLHLEGDRLVPGCSVALATEPVALAATSDFARILVVSRWGAALTLLDGRRLALLGKVALDRDPAAVTVTADDRRAVVAHAVGGIVSIVSLIDGSLATLAVARTEHRSRVRSKKYEALPFESDGPTTTTERIDHRGAQGFAVARADDGRVIMPLALVDTARHGLVGYGSGRTTVGAQATLAPAADRLELSRGLRHLADDCLLPRAAVHDADRQLVWVACLGVDAVIAFADDRFGQARGRVALGAGPIGVALDADQSRLVSWSEGGELAITALPAEVSTKPLTTERIAIARRRPISEELALGRKIFHLAGVDRRLAQDGRACASCHPDGRDDGLTWATATGPRQTPMIVERLEGTAPYGWDGANGELDEHLRRTLTRLSGTGLDSGERAALLAYLRSLRAPEQEPAVDEALVARGGAVFESQAAACASCHPGGASDGLDHDVGSRTRFEASPRYDTPSLRFVGRSAPYFHDGRYPSLEELLADPESQMGQSAALSSDDRRALAAYLRSL